MAQRDALAEVAGHDRAGRVREKDLAAAAGRRDPGGTHDVEPGVALVPDGGLAGVQAEPDLDRCVARPRGLAVRALDVDRRAHGLAGTHERVEERVALGVDLLSLVGGEDLAHEPPMQRQQLGVVRVAEPLEQGSAALDVAEDERDGASREVQLIGLRSACMPILPGRASRHRRPCQATSAGSTFWFRWNTFAGSYRAFTRASRSRVAGG